MAFDLIHNIAPTQKEISFSDIEKVCPAAFTKYPSPEASNRYGFVDTESAINIMLDHGFVPVRAMQKPCRKLQDIFFAEHMIAFAYPSDLGKQNQRNCLLYNSHNLRSSARLMVGNWRNVCSNQLIKVGEGFDAFLRHSKVTAENFEPLLRNQVKNLDKMMDHIAVMQETKLSDVDCLDFAFDAVQNRWSFVANVEDLESTKKGLVANWQTISESLRVRRFGDGGVDCYSVFNRLQESILKGGVPIFSKTEKNPIWKQRKARKVTSLSENVKLNANLFALAESYSK